MLQAVVCKLTCANHASSSNRHRQKLQNTRHQSCSESSEVLLCIPWCVTVYCSSLSVIIGIGATLHQPPKTDVIVTEKLFRHCATLDTPPSLSLCCCCLLRAMPNPSSQCACGNNCHHAAQIRFALPAHSPVPFLSSSPPPLPICAPQHHLRHPTACSQSHQTIRTIQHLASGALLAP